MPETFIIFAMPQSSISSLQLYVLYFSIKMSIDSFLHEVNNSYLSILKLVLSFKIVVLVDQNWRKDCYLRQISIFQFVFFLENYSCGFFHRGLSLPNYTSQIKMSLSLDNISFCSVLWNPVQRRMQKGPIMFPKMSTFKHKNP